jgi:hypothetical protein
MKRLQNIVNWLNDHKPSIGFYIGNNPWDSSKKDSEIVRLTHICLERHKALNSYEAEIGGLKWLVELEQRRVRNRGKRYREAMAEVKSLREKLQIAKYLADLGGGG